MHMRVLSYRHVQSKEVFCHHCGAELEYLYTDVKTRTGKTFFITCPVCGRNIKVPPFVIEWGKQRKNNR